ncbi:MAG: Rap1a/Tai family immunity protein [Desulfobacterales bacterium]|nr:Rap1a/Tai family immunity protein [Desulfobacterales bacterium]
MKLLSIVMGVVIILVMATGSSAECGPMNSGHNLLACIESSDPQLYGYGLGFISGVTFAYRAIYDGTMKPEKICIPKGVKIKEVKLVVEDYLSNHPDKLDKEPWILVSEAIREAFRCY